MRVHGQKNTTFGGTCGRKVVSVTETGLSRPFPLYCKRWTCQDCRERLIDENISKAKEVFRRCLFLYQVVYEANLPGLKTILSKAGTYCRITLYDGRLLIISSKKLKGSTKMKKNEINTIMSVALDYDQPGRRISWGKIPDDCRGKKKESPPSYGLIDADYRLPFYSCKSEEEKARWIFQNKNRFLRIYTAGKELINKYEDQMRIPAQAATRFRSKSPPDSVSFRHPIPGESATRFRSKSPPLERE